MMIIPAVLAILSAIVCQPALVAAASPQQSAPQERTTLKPQIAITTATGKELEKALAEHTIEHRSEVSRADRVTVVVSIEACEPDQRGRCNASADVVAYAPDGRIHSERKNIEVANRHATTTLVFGPGDPPGIYRVEAIVRDLTTRRFGRTERSFGLR